MTASCGWRTSSSVNGYVAHDDVRHARYHALCDIILDARLRGHDRYGISLHKINHCHSRGGENLFIVMLNLFQHPGFIYLGAKSRI